MSEKIEEMSALQLMALETFVENMEADPKYIDQPGLEFFKDFLVNKCNATLPDKPFGAAVEEEEEEDPPDDVPDDQDPGKLQEDKRPFPSVAPKDPKELTDDQMDAQHEAKQVAIDALEAGDLQKALDKYTEYMMFGNPTAMGYAKRAEILLKLKRPNACIADCSAAIIINPDSGKAYRIRGRAYRALQNWYEAHKDLAMGQKLDYDDETAEVQKFVDAKWNRLEKQRRMEKKRKERIKEAEEAAAAKKKQKAAAAAAGPGPGPMPMPPMPTPARAAPAAPDATASATVENAD